MGFPSQRFVLVLLFALWCLQGGQSRQGGAGASTVRAEMYLLPVAHGEEKANHSALWHVGLGCWE